MAGRNRPEDEEDLDLEVAGSEQEPEAEELEAEVEAAGPEPEADVEAEGPAKAVRAEEPPRAPSPSDLELERYRRQEALAYAREQEAAEREYLAKATPEQRVEYKLQKIQEENRQRAFQDQLERDRFAFQASAATNPERRRLADRVERIFQAQLQAPPQYPTRETIYQWLRGQEAEASASKKPRRVVSDEVRRQKVAPVNARGDTGGRRRMSAAELEDALDKAVRF